MSAPAVDLRTAALPAATRPRANEALRLLTTGFSVVPMLPRSKEPHHAILRAMFGRSTWTPLKARAASPAELLSWFEQDAECGIAMILPDDIAAVDIDHPEQWSDLALPATLAHRSSYDRSGRPKSHLLYKVDRPVDTRREVWGEVLGGGHLVIVPPSIHPSGAPYAWFDGMAPGEVEIAAAPSWMYGRKTATPPLQPAQLGATARGRRKAEGRGGASAPESLGTEPSEPGIRVRKNTLSYPDPGAQSDGRRDWPFRDMADREDVALAVLQAAGARPKPLGKAFRCPLPGHHDRKPSAALWRQDGKPVALHDFHVASGTVWWPLPDVFAALTTGETRTLKAAERETWWLRGLYEAGFIEPPTMHATKVDASAPPAAKKLHEGFALLLGLRAFHDASQTAAPYAWDFARGWSGLRSNSEVQRGMKWLLERRYLVIVRRGQGRHAAMLALGRPEVRA